MDNKYLILISDHVIDSADSIKEALDKAEALAEKNRDIEYKIFKYRAQVKKTIPYSLGDEVEACCAGEICEIIAMGDGLKSGCCRVAVRNIKHPLCVCNSHPVTNAKPDGDLLYVPDLKLIKKGNPVDMLFRGFLGCKR